MGLKDFGLDLGRSNPDFVKLAESFGAHGHRVTEHSQFPGVVERCLGSRGVHVIEVPIDYAVSSHLQARSQSPAYWSGAAQPPDAIAHQSQWHRLKC